MISAARRPTFVSQLQKALPETQDRTRWLGWFLMSVGLVSAGTNTVNGAVGKDITVLTLALGLWLVVRANQIMPISDSTKVLIAEEAEAPPTEIVRHRASQLALTAYMLGVAGGAVIILTTMLGLINQTPALPVGMALLVISSLLYAWYTHSEPLYGISAILGGIAFASMDGSLFWVLCVVALSIGATFLATTQGRFNRLGSLLFLAYLPLAAWLLSPSDVANTLMAGAAIVGLFVITLVVSLPFMYRRRKASERERIRQVLIAAYGAFTLILLGLPFEAIGYRTLLQLTPAGMAFGAALVAYLGYGKYSYAKYFVIIGVVSTMAVCGAILSYPLFIGILLITGSAIVLLGLARDSYTLRLTGMGVVAAAHLLYLFNLISLLLAGLSYPPPAEQVYLGLAFGLSLPMLAIAYETLPAKGVESAFRGVLTTSLWIAALFITSLVVGLASTGLKQSALWVCVGLAGMLCGKARKHPFLVAAALALAAVAASKLIFVDLFSF